MKLISVVFIIICSLIVAEVLLRILMPFENVFGTSYSRGIHSPDPVFGYVFTNNYKGIMSHPDKVVNIPLQLDENGFRLMAKNKANYDLQQTSANVMLLGAASMAFSVGLSDKDKLADQISRNANCPARIYTASLPGIDLLRNFHMYQRLLEKKIEPKLIILFLYDETPEYINSLPDNFLNLQSIRSKDELFLYFDDLVTVQSNKFALMLLGRNYYKSYFLSKLLYPVDRLWREVSFIYTKLIDNNKQREITNDTRKNKEAFEKFVRLIIFFKEYFSVSDTKLKVVILPSMGNQDKSFISDLKYSLPTDIIFQDLSGLSGSLKSKDYIAAGHYGQTASSTIGRVIGSEICDHL
jgi:hypothetical protein